jgi:7-cyano-7-deazaguanine synthase
MSKAVVVVSGGMDSVTLLHMIAKERNYTEVKALSFDYYQRHRKELLCAAFQANDVGASHIIVSLDFLKFETSALTNRQLAVPTIEDVLGHPQPITYVPNRNMILLSIAAGMAEDFGASHLYYGAQRHDQYGYWDTTPDFLEAINNVLSLNRGMHAVRIYAPFIEHSKADILEVGFRLGVDYSQTFSCYRGERRSCGTCPTCAERRKAFRDLGKEDPLEYAT